MELTEAEWKQIKKIIKAARAMVYEDQDYWVHDYKEDQARALIEAIKKWDESQ